MKCDPRITDLVYTSFRYKTDPLNLYDELRITAGFYILLFSELESYE
jgi:hypothetical protein